jgi:hypothetical protein
LSEAEIETYFQTFYGNKEISKDKHLTRRKIGF